MNKDMDAYNYIEVIHETCKCVKLEWNHSFLNR